MIGRFRLPGLFQQTALAFKSNHPGHKLQPGYQTAPFFVDMALNVLISNDINLIHGSELADPPQQRLSVYQALVGLSLLWVNKPSGSHQTCKRLFHEWIMN